jgi:hypothetical protein
MASDAPRLIYGRWKVICTVCQQTLNSGFGLWPTWEQPHPPVPWCEGRDVTIEMIYTEEPK